MPSREANYDLLRGVCMLSVIAQHVSGSTISWNSTNIWVSYLWMGGAAWDVPCFLMLTGAFAINNFENKNAKLYLKKSIQKIVVPTLIFSMFYSLWYFIAAYHKNGEILKSLLQPLTFWATGWYGHPLWYMYTLIGITLFIPILSYFRSQYKEKRPHIYFGAVTGYSIWSFLSMFFENSHISWSTDHVFHYLGFVLLGSLIKDLVRIKNNYIGVLFVLIGMVVSYLLWLAYGFLLPIQSNLMANLFTSTASPFSVFACILIFSGTAMLTVQRNFNIIVKYSFYVYLFHLFVIQVCAHIGKILGIQGAISIYFYIPLMIGIVSSASLILAIVYLFIEKFIKSKWTYKMN